MVLVTTLTEAEVTVGTPEPILTGGYIDIRGYQGRFTLYVKNTGTEDAIIRYYYQNAGPRERVKHALATNYPVQFSLDTDIENLCASGESIMIVLEAGAGQEMLQVTAIKDTTAGAILEGVITAHQHMGYR